MKRLVASLSGTVMGLITTLSGSTLARELSIHPQLKRSSPVVKGNKAFALDLYRQLRNQQDLRNCHKRSRNSAALSAKKLKDKQRNIWALQLFN